MLRSAEVLVDRVLADEKLLAQFKDDPQILSRVAQEVIGELPPMPPDTWIYRLVVGSLGLTVLIVVVGAIILSLRNVQEIPAILTAIGSAAVGALAACWPPPPAVIPGWGRKAEPSLTRKR
ncbi:MAG: hypothetical protein K6T55_09705 [Syntrophobacterales bacterium]|nr:hypothetical protein [Syntrophobacterales bacterium]